MPLNEVIINNSNNELLHINELKRVGLYSKDTSIEEIDSIKFGKYEQDCNLKNGAEDIEWIILSNEDSERVVLLSKYILATRCFTYMNNAEIVDWDTSDLKKWLNDDFYNQAFSDYDKELISDSYTRYGIFNDNYLISTDKVCILSYNDLKKYLGDNSFYKKDNYKWRTSATDYSKYYLYNGRDKDGYVDYWCAPNYKNNGSQSIHYVGSWGEDLYTYVEHGWVLGVRPSIIIDTTKSIDINQYSKKYKNNLNIFNEEEFISSIKKAKTVLESVGSLGIEDLDTIKYGKYKQDSYNIDIDSDIEWIVLEKDDEKALLMSKYVLLGYDEHFNAPYNYYESIGKKYVNYNPGDYSYYLNKVFYNQVFLDNKHFIIPVSFKDDDTLDFDFDNNILSEYVFLLSYNDYKKYFGKNNLLSIAKPTDYAKEHEGFDYIDYDYFYEKFYIDNEDMVIFSKKDFEIKYNGFIGNASYFLRNLFVVQNDYIKGLVSYDGEVDEISGAYPYHGIRPAIWVSIK